MIRREPNQGARWLARLLSGALAFVVGAALLVWRHSSPAHPRSLAAGVEVARANLVRTDGRWCRPGQTNPFSGWMIESYPNGQLCSRSEISNGLLHGLSMGWHTNGQLQITEHFRAGLAHGLRTKWYRDGTKQSEANIAGGKLEGRYRKWHENGLLSEEVEFVGGRPAGVSLAYYPSGQLKARVVLGNAK